METQIFVSHNKKNKQEYNHLFFWVSYHMIIIYR